MSVLEYLEFTQLSNLIGMLAKILHRFRVPGIYTALKPRQHLKGRISVLEYLEFTQLSNQHVYSSVCHVVLEYLEFTQLSN